MWTFDHVLCWLWSCLTWRTRKLFRNSSWKKSSLERSSCHKVGNMLPISSSSHDFQSPSSLTKIVSETLSHSGEFERGVDHLTNAIAVCGQPQQLLQVLQQTLPPPVFQMLLTKLPTISQVRIYPASCKIHWFNAPASLINPPVAICGLWDKKGCKINLRIIQSWEHCVCSS